MLQCTGKVCLPQSCQLLSPARLAKLIRDKINKYGHLPAKLVTNITWECLCVDGLDVTAKWELLTRCKSPVPKPTNVDETLWPPTEMNASPNPKYGFVETFDCIPTREDVVLPAMRSIRPAVSEGWSLS